MNSQLWLRIVNTQLQLEVLRIYTSKVVILLLLFVGAFSAIHVLAKTVPDNIYVDLSGTEFGSGEIDNPLNQLSNAITLARNNKNSSVNIWLREGHYFIDKVIVLSAIDSRDAKYPLIISAYQDEVVTLSGGKSLPYWNKVVDSKVLKRLPANAKKQVYVTNLKQYGISDFGTPEKLGVELFKNDKKMQLARYPNDGELVIEKLVEPNTKVIRSHRGSKAGKFYYRGNFADRWLEENDIWLHGYWFWDWKDQNQKVKNIDTQNKIIELEKPFHHYGYRNGQGYYAFNVLAELDNENEWYLNRNNGDLYVYSQNEMNKDTPLMVAVSKNLIEFNDVSNVILKNLSIAYARNNGVSIKGGENNRLDNLIIKHIGNKAVAINNSDNSSISSSELYSIGATAISIKGGDRATLTPANICAINNKIHNYAMRLNTYKYAVSVGGVGNCVKNNEIFNAPHIAIYFEGNNHLIEYNNIHDVVKQSNDAGAIYAGRDWTSRGTEIKHNYLHNINGYKGRGAKGIYLDDEFSGVKIEGNIFDNVRDAVFVGGGRDNIINNNLFVNTTRSLTIDARGIGWGKGAIKQLTQKLNRLPHDSPIWKNQYPQLSKATTVNARLPVNNVINNNVFYDESWNGIYSEAKPYITLQNNHELIGKKPTKTYQVYEKLKGFTNIDFENIGIQH